MTVSFLVRCAGAFVLLATTGCAPATPSSAPSAVTTVSAASAASPATRPTVPAGAKQTAVKMALTGLSPASWPLFVGEERGFYEGAGLKMEHVVIASSVTQTQALVAGDVQFQTNSVDSVAKAVTASAPLKYVGTAQAIPNFRVIVGKDVSGWSDLKGKTLAAGNPGGFFNVMLAAMLAANGLKEGDYEILTISNSADRLPALQAGRIAGAIMGGPDDAKALAAGFKSLGYVHEYVPDVEYNGYAVNEQWGRANATTVVAFLQGTRKALDWLFDPANQAEAVNIYAKTTGLDTDSVKAMYEQLVQQKMLSRDMRPNLKGIEKILSLEVEQGILPSFPPFQNWIDVSYLDQAAR